MSTIKTGSTNAENLITQLVNGLTTDISTDPEKIAVEAMGENFYAVNVRKVTREFNVDGDYVEVTQWYEYGFDEAPYQIDIVVTKEGKRNKPITIKA